MSIMLACTYGMKSTFNKQPTGPSGWQARAPLSTLYLSSRKKRIVSPTVRGFYFYFCFIKINCTAGLYLLSITICTMPFSCLVTTTGSNKIKAGECVTMVPVYSAE